MTDAKKYHLETLRFLMGSARRDDLLPGWRFDMIGRPQEVQADGDEGLALLDVRPDGVYVKAMEDDKGHRSVEISFLTGDNGGRRHSGLPLLPIPFTVDDLRRVQGGALGIVEGLSCGEDTDTLLAKLGTLDQGAEEAARALMAMPKTPGDNGAGINRPAQERGDLGRPRDAHTIETYYLGWSMVCPPPPITKSSEASARHQRATSDRVELIKAKAPAAPPCFGYRDTWLGWLHAAETSNDVRVFKWKGRTGAGEQHRGRIKTEEFSESIDFCKDCTGEYKRQMQACGRCLHSSQRPTDQPGIEVKTELSSMCLSSGLVRKTA